ncbi:unnamed protein product [Blepharisma stoltei]|uniref:cGMP-dependent protein kinase n=1 Tax=Blepharisma stoltei TaxID=1481888 RepID=A0AAU9J1W7_9CILI|nr:unnamed protein product [Blepharisma stoltei]
MGCGIKTMGIKGEYPEEVSVNQEKNNNEDSKSTPFLSSDQARKHLKRKAAVIDSRLEAQESLDAPTATITNKIKSETDANMINKSLSRHFIFNSLTDEQRDLVIDQMKHYSLGSNSIIFEENQSGNNFFVIISGKLEVLIKGKRVNILKPGDSFGELALLHDTPRTATIKTIEKSTLWGLDRRTFRNAIEALNAMNYNENKHFINSIPLFQILTMPQKEALVGSLTSIKFSAGQRIVNEGDPGDLFYIIKDGTVSCVAHGREIRRMAKGDYFGEQALLYNSPRTATISAIDDVRCAAIWRENLTKALGSHLQQIIYRNSQRMALDKSSVLCRLIKSQADSLIANMKIQSFEAGTIVIAAGTPYGEYLWIVVKGTVIKETNREIFSEVFCCIGDKEIVNNENNGTFDENLIAGDNVDIAMISKTEFEACIGGQYSQVTSNNEALKVLKQIQLLRSLSFEKMNSLLRALKIEQYIDRQVIVQQNNPGDSLFIIKKGKVEVFKDNLKIRAITKHDYFGERSVLFDDFRSATVIANGMVSCWVISKADFLEIIDDQIRVQLLKRIELQDDTINIEDLSVVKSLGKGNFGIVTLVVHNIKRTLYALKSVDRHKINAYELQESLTLERRILQQMDHVFVMKLIKTFRDTKRIYFLLEYVRGMDLFDVLRQMGIVSEKDARFYISCLIYILEHLHEHDIVYRDLKPENIMVDDEGYPKLIDFGTAKIVIGRTYTIVGTPHYMAPELITGKGYGIAVDLWSLGIMLYEFLCGGVPFAEDEEEPYEIYKRILERNLVYPSWAEISPNARNLIEQFLSKDPVLRTGGSYEILKCNPWLSGMDWDKLVCKILKAPYIPQVPNLRKEADLAIKKQTSLDEFISKQEEQVSGNIRIRRGIATGWDLEF